MAPGGDAPYTTDMSEWPLVIWRMNRALTVPEFTAYLADVDKVLARRERYAQVVVSCLGEGRSALTVETRKLQAQWVKKNFDVLQERCAAMVVVISDMSPIAHFTISVLMSVLGRAPSPSKILTVESEGIAWARAHLAKGSPMVSKASMSG